MPRTFTPRTHEQRLATTRESLETALAVLRTHTETLAALAIPPMDASASRAVEYAAMVAASEIATALKHLRADATLSGYTPTAKEPHQ